MGVKTASLGKTTDSGRIEFTWVSTIGRLVKQIGLPGFAPKPDLDKLKAAMDKAKKPLDWQFSFDNVKCVFTVQADIGGAVVVIGRFDVLAEKDAAKRRDAMQKLRDATEVVTSKDLADFDRKFPPPPDPKKLDALKKELERLLLEIKRDEGFKKTLPTTFKSMESGLREVGFTHWAEPLRLDRFIEFADGVENGVDPKKLAAEFIVTKAPRLLQVSPATRAAVDAAMAAAKVPDLKAAHDEVVRIIDTTILPRFRKDTIAGIDKRLVDAKKQLALKQAELKTLLGR
jgi:hypothetical protein